MDGGDQVELFQCKFEYCFKIDLKKIDMQSKLTKHFKCVVRMCVLFDFSLV